MLEYAVEILQVEAIVVMGHSGCDGIRAFLTRMLGPETTCENSAEKCVHDGFIAKWTGLLRPAWGAVLRARASETEHGLEARLGKRSISYSIENLNTFPLIKHRIEAGLLNIYGVYFDSSVGALSILNAEMRSFEKFSGAMALHREHRTTGVH